jgi:hypothetical protein
MIDLEKYSETAIPVSDIGDLLSDVLRAVIEIDKRLDKLENEKHEWRNDPTLCYECSMPKDGQHKMGCQTGKELK